MTPHLNHHDETDQMTGRNVVSVRNKKIIPQLSSNTPFYLELCKQEVYNATFVIQTEGSKNI